MVSYYFPPLADVGSLRALGYSKNLKKLGWEPHVISVKNPDKSLTITGNESIPENVQVYYANSLFHLNKFTWKANGLLNIILKVFGQKLESNIIHDLICFPDIFVGWILPCLFKAVAICRKQKIDVIYVSCKPFSGALVGVLLKKIIKKPLVMDFRDPVSFPSFIFNKTWIGRLRRRYIRKLENKILQNSDKFIVTSNETEAKYLSIYPYLEGRIHRIYNGYFLQLDRQCQKQNKDKFIIAYSGNFYLDLTRSDTFFPALEEIIAKKLISPEKLEFLYVGKIKGKNNWLEELALKHGIINNVRALGQVGRKKSLEIMASSQLILLRIVPPMISTKLFEGLSLGVPFLATINSGEVEQLINKYSKNSFVITSNKVDDVRDAIVKAYRMWESGELKKGINQEYIDKFNKAALTKEFADVLEEVHRHRNKKFSNIQ